MFDCTTRQAFLHDQAPPVRRQANVRQMKAERETLTLERLSSVQEHIGPKRQGLRKAAKRMRCAVDEQAQLPKEEDAQHSSGWNLACECQGVGYYTRIELCVTIMTIIDW